MKQEETIKTLLLELLAREEFALIRSQEDVRCCDTVIQGHKDRIRRLKNAANALRGVENDKR